MLIERCSNEIWRESIILSVAGVARAQPRAAEDVIEALLETQSPEGILLAGRAFLEIMHEGIIKELQEKVIKSLNALTSDTQIADILQEQAKAILDRLV